MFIEINNRNFQLRTLICCWLLAQALFSSNKWKNYDKVPSSKFWTNTMVSMNFLNTLSIFTEMVELRLPLLIHEVIIKAWTNDAFRNYELSGHFNSHEDYQCLYREC